MLKDSLSTTCSLITVACMFLHVGSFTPAANVHTCAKTHFARRLQPSLQASVWRTVWLSFKGGPFGASWDRFVVICWIWFVVICMLSLK